MIHTLFLQKSSLVLSLLKSLTSVCDRKICVGDNFLSHTHTIEFESYNNNNRVFCNYWKVKNTRDCG